MKGLEQLISDITIWTGSVNSTFYDRALTVTAILGPFEFFAGIKIVQLKRALKKFQDY